MARSKICMFFHVAYLSPGRKAYPHFTGARAPILVRCAVVSAKVGLALTAWHFRVALLVVGMTTTGLALMVICCIAFYNYGFPRKPLTWPVALWLAAWVVGGWLLGPAASLLGHRLAYRGQR